MKNKIVLLLALSALLWFSCDDKDLVAPYYRSATENFQITTPLSYDAPANLLSGSVNLQAGFNEEVTWILDITGQFSNAKKQFQGTGDNINIFWDGRSNEGVFVGGENADVVLTIYNSEVTDAVVLPIATANYYSNSIIVTDFEDNVDSSRFDQSDFTFSNTEEAIETGFFADGTGFNGTFGRVIAADGPDEFSGTSGLKSRGSRTLPGLTGTADETYINFYARSATNDLSLFKVQVSFLNGETFNIEYEFEPEWKLYSFAFSDLGVPDAYLPDLNQVMFIGKSEQTGHVIGLDVDYIIITEGKVFDPNKP